MEIRKSAQNDVDVILHLFDIARAYMAAHGNATQWIDGYPGRDVLLQDIASENSYVMLDDEHRILGTFTFIIGSEPNYQIITDGAWHHDLPYGTIHRVASNGKAKGIARACFNFCTQLIPYVRIDTHKNNQSMQAAIRKYGFRECGTVYMQNGTERTAFDYLRPGYII